MNFRLFLNSFAWLLCSSLLGAMEQPDGQKIESLVKEIQLIQQPKLKHTIAYYLNLAPLPTQMDSLQFAETRKLCIKQKYAPLLAELLTVKNGVRILDPNSICNDSGGPFRLLTEAVYKKAYSNVEVLLDAGADPNCIASNAGENDIFQESPLYTAVNLEDPHLLFLLLKKGADANKHYETYDNLPLMRVVQNYVCTDPGDRSNDITLPLISLLLKFGANPNEKQPNGFFKSTSVPECRDDDYKKYHTACALAQAHNAQEILHLFKSTQRIP